MVNYIFIIIIIISYIILWFIINLLAYFLSVAFKTKKIFGVMAGLAYIVYYIFNFFYVNRHNYSWVTLSTSSTLVSPLRALIKPSWVKVIMPWASAIS